MKTCMSFGIFFPFANYLFGAVRREMRLAICIAAAALAGLASSPPAQAAGVLYGLSSSFPGSLYTINSATGAASLVTNLSNQTSIVGLEARQGVLYASDVNGGGGAQFGTINPSTGAFTALNNQR